MNINIELQFIWVRVRVFNTSTSKIFQLYHGGKFYWWRKPGKTYRKWLSNFIP